MLSKNLKAHCASKIESFWRKLGLVSKEVFSTLFFQLVKIFAILLALLVKIANFLTCHLKRPGKITFSKIPIWILFKSEPKILTKVRNSVHITGLTSVVMCWQKSTSFLKCLKWHFFNICLFLFQTKLISWRTSSPTAFTHFCLHHNSPH